MSEQMRCRSCQEPIEFRRTVNGRSEPISLRTGESHFIDCPQRREWRKADQPSQTSFLSDVAPKPDEGRYPV